MTTTDMASPQESNDPTAVAATPGNGAEDGRTASPSSSTGRVLDVQQALDGAPFGGYRWLIFVLCFLIVLFDGFDTAAIGYIAPSLMSEWGVEKSALAPVLSAALFGLAAGALSAGPLADRLGRKKVLIGSVAVFGAGCLASAFSADLQTLTWLRFLTGVGLGAAMPNAVTLMSEYSPMRQRSLITNAMFCGFPLGASCGGFLAAWMIPEFGWRSVLVLGGVLPLVLMLALIVFLPESIRYMVTHGWQPARIRRVLTRVVGDKLASAERYVLPEMPADKAPAADADAPSSREARGLGIVLSSRYLLGSLMLWIAYFMGLVVFYAMINWMPVLFRSIEIEAATASRITALFPLGGIAAIVLGWMMDRYNATIVLALGYLGTALSVWAIGQAVGNMGVLMLLVFVAGVIMNATQASMPALGAHFYPTRGRATGVAWMLGVGRFGGIAGSFLVAALTARQFDFAGIFAVLAIPGLIATVALLIKALVYRDQASSSS